MVTHVGDYLKKTLLFFKGTPLACGQGVVKAEKNCKSAITARLIEPYLFVL
jgi:hypothetical protein